MPKDIVQFTFLTNHTYVLVCLARDPRARLRDVARHVGITERATQRIIAELEAAGILRRFREGRRNRYEIDREQPLRHALEEHRTVGDLLYMLLQPERTQARRAGANPAPGAHQPP